MPLVSIIIPTYCQEKTIELCLQSLFRQTLKDFEIIVVNDGSPDKTSKILFKYQDLIKIVNQEHRGAPAARNHGAQFAQGRFFLFCDSDIIAAPQMLERLVKALDSHLEAAYAYSSFKFGWKIFKSQPFDPHALKQKNYIHTTSLIRREFFPGFDESLKKFQDWDLWLTMLERGYQGVWVPEVLFQVIPLKQRISVWLPKFVYYLPWQLFPWQPKAIKSYLEALAIIKQKHHLD